MDDYEFCGGKLHICYAPEYETVEDTRAKLEDRRRAVARRIHQLAGKGRFCFIVIIIIILRRLPVGEAGGYTIHRVPEKGATKLMMVTSSNLNRFSKCFHHFKENEISNKIPTLFSTTR